ncbi:MAG: ATP-grasp domain-containing protein [Halobacteriales archaeon]
MGRDSVTVGVLSLHTSKETKAILNAVDALGHRPVWLRRDNIGVHLTGGAVDLSPDVDVVLNRLLVSRSSHPAELLGLAEVYEGVVPVLNGPAAVLGALHKVGAATALHAAGVPVPESYLGIDPATLDAGRAHFEDRAVYKLAIGTHGDGTSLVDPDEPLIPKAVNRQAFLQRFIASSPTKPHDYRIYVVGGTVEAAMRRTAKEGEFRTNVAEGGLVEDATSDLPQEALDIARRATAAIGLDYAGIDVIAEDDAWYVLEVNPTAGFRGLYAATDHSPAPAMARLAIERAGGSVDESRVDELARTLDTTLPPGVAKAPPDPGADRPTIGYTERVSVSGTTGTELVVAKSDTGARRTSIDLELAAAIGAGPIKHQTRVRSGLQAASKARPVVDLLVGVNGDWHEVTASVEDRSHMGYEVLLGRDILRHYHVDVTREVTEE